MRYLSLGSQPAWIQWSIVLALSILFILGLTAFHLPAVFLLGPMMAAILASAMDGTLRVPAELFRLTQGVIGCMIARSIPLSVIMKITQDWPLFLTGVSAVIIVAATLGWLLARWQVLPGTTAVWGSFPGAATVMTLMSQSFGADMRLVAFMQYLRVVCVSLVASLLSRLWTAGSGAPVPETLWFPTLAWGPFIATCALACIGPLLAERLRIPAGSLLVPLALAVTLQDTGMLTIELPPWLLAVSYMLVGWSVGARFTRPILFHAAQAFPRVLLSIFLLIAICGLFAVLLVFLGGIDPLTAYLATSPGGADSVAIIAASAKVDLPFVMAMQIARFLIVLFIGPIIARFVAKHSGIFEDMSVPEIEREPYAKRIQ